MSTGFACEVIEASPDNWYVVLQNWDCPVGAWDWHEYATAYGPYSSPDVAMDELHKNEANPGGWVKIPYQADSKPGDVLRKLIEDAKPWPTY